MATQSCKPLWIVLASMFRAAQPVAVGFWEVWIGRWCLAPVVIGLKPEGASIQIAAQSDPGALGFWEPATAGQPSMVAESSRLIVWPLVYCAFHLFYLFEQADTYNTLIPLRYVNFSMLEEPCGLEEHGFSTIPYGEGWWTSGALQEKWDALTRLLHMALLLLVGLRQWFACRTGWCSTRRLKAAVMGRWSPRATPTRRVRCPHLPPAVIRLRFRMGGHLACALPRHFAAHHKTSVVKFGLHLRR